MTPASTRACRSVDPRRPDPMDCSLDLAHFSCSLSLSSSSSLMSKLFIFPLSVYVFLVSLSVYLSVFFYLSVYPSVCIYLCIYISAYLTPSVNKFLSSHLSTSTYPHISINLPRSTNISIHLFPTRVSPILGADHLSCQSHSASRLVCTHDCPRGERPTN